MITLGARGSSADNWMMLRKPAGVSRRGALALLGKASIALSCGLTGRSHSSVQPRKKGDSEASANLFDSMQLAAFRFFWEQASSTTGLIKDRAATKGTDTRTESSIAAGGFGLTALCIADFREYQPKRRIKERVIATLSFLLNKAPSVNGFFYHYMDMNTGARYAGSEVSSIDTAILLCGALMCRAYFKDEQITRLSLALYDRVNWRWMLNGGSTLSHAWTPETGFFASRWNSYSELMMMYLLAIGSRTNPIHSCPNCESDN